MKEIFESYDAAVRRTQGIIEMSSVLRKVDDKKLYEACEKAAIFNESEDLGEILNQALETVKSEHPELVSNPNANETVAVASANTDQELFYGEYKLKLNLSSLSDGYIEIVVSKNGIETVKAEDKPQEAPKEEEKPEENPAKDENATPEGDQTENTTEQPAEEKKESALSKKNAINESYGDRVDELWTKLEDYFENLNYKAVAIITSEEVVFVDETILSASFAGDQWLTDTEGYELNLVDCKALIPIASKLDIRGVKTRKSKLDVFTFVKCDGEWQFVQEDWADIVNNLI